MGSKGSGESRQEQKDFEECSMRSEDSSQEVRDKRAICWYQSASLQGSTSFLRWLTILQLIDPN